MVSIKASLSLCHCVHFTCTHDYMHVVGAFECVRIGVIRSTSSKFADKAGGGEKFEKASRTAWSGASRLSLLRAKMSYAPILISAHTTVFVQRYRSFEIRSWKSCAAKLRPEATLS